VTQQLDSYGGFTALEGTATGWFHLEGLYDWEGNPKPGLVEAVAQANKGIYGRAVEPYDAGKLAALDADFFGLWDETHVRN